MADAHDPTDSASLAEQRLRAALASYAARFEPAQLPPSPMRQTHNRRRGFPRSRSRLVWSYSSAMAVTAAIVVALVMVGQQGVRKQGIPEAHFIETAGASTPQYAAVPRPLTAPGTTMAAIQARGYLRVGIKYDQPAFGVRDPASGDVRGFDAEIARLIAVGIFGGSVSEVTPHVRFEEAVSRNREAMLQGGAVDIVVATYSITGERTEKVDFAGPYFRARQDIMVRVGASAITGVDDLSGRPVCTVRGSTSLLNLQRRNPNALVVARDTYSECASALAAGEVDAVTTDQPILAGYAHQSGGSLRVLDNPFSDELYGIGIPKGDQALRSYLNERLGEIVANGDWARAHRAWLADIISVPPPIGIVPS